MNFEARTSLATVVLFALWSQACRSDSARTHEADIVAHPNAGTTSRADATTEPVHDAGVSGAAPVIASVDASPSRYLRATIAGREAVIVPEARAADHLEAVLFDRTGDPPLRRSALARGGAVTGYFSPDDACLERLEAGLEGFLKKGAHAPAGLASRQRSYKRQYAGFRTDGPRVHASFLCRELHAWEWTSYPYLARYIAGGGDCFFEVVFGCEDGVYSDFATSD